MKRISENRQQESLFQCIKVSLLNMYNSKKDSLLDILLYYKMFPNETDYNIVKYGNLLVHYQQILELYRGCGYKSIEELSPHDLWGQYLFDVGWVIDNMILTDVTCIIDLIDAQQVCTINFD